MMGICVFTILCKKRSNYITLVLQNLWLSKLKVQILGSKTRDDIETFLLTLEISLGQFYNCQWIALVICFSNIIGTYIARTYWFRDIIITMFIIEDKIFGFFLKKTELALKSITEILILLLHLEISFFH